VNELTTLRIDLSEKEMEWIKNIANEEHIPENVLVKKLVLDGLDKYRIDEAILMYKNKKLNLNASAQFAGISVREFMIELESRDIALNLTQEMVNQSLNTLAQSFNNDELKRVMSK
jgi:predicted HTH domain antitoxin